MKKIAGEKPETYIAQDVLDTLTSQKNSVKAKLLQGFFKTGPGEYGEGDKFLGLTVPEQRDIARKYQSLPLDQLRILFNCDWHEARLTAGLILVSQYERASSLSERKLLVDYFLNNLDRINNWDIVDSTAPKILGLYQLESAAGRQVVKRLVKSKNLWHQRVAVLSQFPAIKQGQFDDMFEIAGVLLDHPHDLIHKAVGWMLREVGKNDQEQLLSFLRKFAARMPRTMLRYAIEKLSLAEREYFMKAKT